MHSRESEELPRLLRNFRGARSDILYEDDHRKQLNGVRNRSTLPRQRSQTELPIPCDPALSGPERDFPLPPRPCAVDGRPPGGVAVDGTAQGRFLMSSVEPDQVDRYLERAPNSVQRNYAR
jgi:hypothetical protein